ncbi:MAG: UvrD-helicase domain-containing protein [Pseudomonadota bacterium]
MSSIISITDDDVAYAQNILLPEGVSFDDERKAFITNLDTIDLHASPGSGKTTALLTKLLVLAKHMPFKNNSGILVLSHTNAAVDEIHSKIHKHCPHLFSYPNYVGTIQGFVNKFLAIPCYNNAFKKKPNSIDSETYNEIVSKYNLPYRPNAWVQRKRDPLSFLESVRLNNDTKLISGINGDPDKFELRDSNKPTYKALLKMKLDILESGYLHYDDAYFLANQYLDNCVLSALKSRFKYTFVDEMQDMDKHQHDLLEKIFFEGEDNTSVFQRIGDKNQSIYNGKISLENIWSDRESNLNINGSYRLTKNISNLVNCFALDRGEGFHVNGLREGDIKPCFIIYDDSSVERVIPSFSEKINDLIEREKIPKDNGIYKAISWRKSHDEYIALSDFYPDFNNSLHATKIDHIYLTDYIYLNSKECKSINNSIINIFIKILRMESITNIETRKCYTKTSLFMYLDTNENKYADILRSCIYEWVMAIVKTKHSETIISIREHIPIFLNIFNSEIESSSDFIYTDGPEEQPENDARNAINIHGFDIEITTIHAAKGQTHTGTLYLESYYQGEYETNRLAEQLCGINFSDHRSYHKQATKMAYVGLSRPTHLLCIAIHKDRYDMLKGNLDEKLWEIKNI